MVKVVISSGIGGFKLSEKALSWLEETGEFPGLSEFGYYDHPILGYDEIPRHSPTLVRCVEELGKEAGELEVKTLEGKQYIIQSNDMGIERVYTPLSILEQDWITVNEGDEEYGGTN